MNMKVSFVIHKDDYRRLRELGKYFDRSLSGTIRYLIREAHKKMKEEMKKKNG